MEEEIRTEDEIRADIGIVSEYVQFGDLFEVEAWSYDSGSMLMGNIWTDTIKNLVVNEGLDDALEEYFNGSAYTATHYVGLTDGAPVTVAPGDTMASHAGWNEIHTQYSQATRPLANFATASSQSVTNSANKAVFSITATVTIGGAFITTVNVKGGSGGTLYGGGAFTLGDKGLNDGDTLNVTVTASATAS